MAVAVVEARIMLAVALLATACSTAAQPYPNRTIRFISPNPPGGSTTAVARLIGSKLTESWGQQTIVDNRPGGNGFIGGLALQQSNPDGHTFMVISPAHIIPPLMIPAPYDPINDFTAVATVCSIQYILAATNSLPADTLKELIALAKSKPGGINYASSGNGSPNNLAAELFNHMAGVKITHIPYKGGGPALVDLIGGHVQIAWQIPVTTIQHVKSGRLKAIAVSGETRLSSLPGVPTFIESGLPGYNVESWYGIIGPAGIPKPIVDKFSAEIARYLKQPDFAERLVSEGMEPLASTPEQFAARMKRDTANYANVIKAAKIKAE